MPIRVHSLKRMAVRGIAFAALLFIAPFPALAQLSGKPVFISLLGPGDPLLADVFGGHTLVAWRGELDAPPSVAYMSLFDPQGQLAPGWPENGLRVGRQGFGIPPPFLVRMSDDATGMFWQNSSSGAADVYGAWLSRAGTAVPEPADVVLDTLASGPASQQLYGAARKDCTHALLALYDGAFSPARTVIKPVGPPGAPSTAWPEEGTVISDSISVWPSDVSADSAGGCFVLTAALHSCGRTDPFDPPCPLELRVHHLLGDGSRNPAWPAEGALLTANAGWALFGLVVSDRLGGAYAAWYDTTMDSLRIRAQHLGPDGQPVPGWGLNGVQLAPGLDQVVNLISIRASSTGRLVATIDDYDIPYLVVLEPDGSNAPEWPALTRLVPLGQFFDPIVSGCRTELTPGDSILAVWDLTDSGDDGIWGTALGPDGTVLPWWTPPCTPLCIAPQGQGHVAVALCEDGSFKLAWEDGRNLPLVGYAIYYDHFNLLDGTVPVAATARLLSHSVAGRVLTASWRVAGSAAGSIEALRSVDDDAFEPRPGLSRVGDTDVSLVDSLPASFARVRYCLAIRDSDGYRAVSDTLGVRPADGPTRLRLRADPLQRGPRLALTIETDRNLSGVVLAGYDVSGRRVFESELGPIGAGQRTVECGHDDLPAGMYYVRLRSAQGSSPAVRIARLR